MSTDKVASASSIMQQADIKVFIALTADYLGRSGEPRSKRSPLGLGLFALASFMGRMEELPLTRQSCHLCSGLNLNLISTWSTHLRTDNYGGLITQLPVGEAACRLF